MDDFYDDASRRGDPDVVVATPPAVEVTLPDGTTMRGRKVVRIEAEDPEVVRERDDAHLDGLYYPDGTRIGDRPARPDSDRR
jgi:hypothetical protein